MNRNFLTSVCIFIILSTKFLVILASHGRRNSEFKNDEFYESRELYQKQTEQVIEQIYT